MKVSLPSLASGALGAVAVALLAWIAPLGAQNSLAEDQFLQLTQAIAGQQKLIDENQAAIDKTLATVQEDLRQAKIYVSRAGKAKGAK